ncbi:MAG: hypothetical protein JOY64_28810 [Alphaproteobacteria bacterium]|nr:hypothetical protein [Alphaproteobacteria bacterium]
MKSLVWPLLAALAGLALGCSDSDYALYRSPKLVPGYAPPGDVGVAHAPPSVRDRTTDWRER